MGHPSPIGWHARSSNRQGSGWWDRLYHLGLRTRKSPHAGERSPPARWERRPAFARRLEGLPQEKWIADHLGKIKTPWMCGVGAAFDYHSGEVPWAPPWIQRIGMEWLFRTIIQPKQRIRRYVWSFIFLFEAIFMGLLARNKTTN